MKPKHTLPKFLVLAGSSLLAISSTHAANIWDGGGADNNITTSGNWDDNNVANFSSAITFAGDVRNSVFNDRAAASSFNAINFTNNGTTDRTNAFTLTGSSITLGGNISATAVTTGPAITDVIDVDIILNNNRVVSAASNHNITISGDISETGGNRSLSQTNAGILTLTGSNTYTGATNIQQGTISISSIADFGTASSIGAPASGRHIVMGSEAVIGTLLYTGGAQTTNRTIQIHNSGGNTKTDGGAAIINDGTGALTFNATTFNVAYASTATQNRRLILGGTNGGSITGIIQDNSATTPVRVVKTGDGTWTLGGGNTYTGSTSIDSGTLIINGATSSTSAVAVGASGTLGGGGTIGGTLSVTGKLSPGDGTTPTNTLTLGNSLTLNPNAILAFGLGTNSDRITFSSLSDNLIGSGNATLELSLLSGFSYANTYTIFQNTSTSGFTLSDITGYDTVNYTANFFDGGTSYLLNFTAVPEPSAALLGSFGLLALLRRRR